MKLMDIQSSINEIIEKLWVQEGNVDVKDFKIIKSEADESYEVNISFIRKDSEETYGIASYIN